MMQENTKVTVTLGSPLDVNGAVLSQLSFREAEVGDLVEAQKSTTDLDRLVTMLSRCSGQPIDVIHKIKARDLKNIMKQVGDRLGNEKDQAA